MKKRREEKLFLIQRFSIEENIALKREKVKQTYSHTQKTSRIMTEIEVFISEFGRAIDGDASSSVAIYEISSLDHKVSDLHDGMSLEVGIHGNRTASRTVRNAGRSGRHI